MFQRLILVLLLGASQAKSNASPRTKRAETDRFNVLLNLYKMKPLQQSELYKTYSNNILYESNVVKSIIYSDEKKENNENDEKTEIDTIAAPEIKIVKEFPEERKVARDHIDKETKKRRNVTSSNEVISLSSSDRDMPTENNSLSHYYEVM